jgi:hypothetical protein
MNRNLERNINTLKVLKENYSEFVKKLHGDVTSSNHFLSYLKNEESNKWSNKVKTKWHPTKGLFTKSAEEIASEIFNGSEDYGTAIKRLTFYINRAGSNLSDERKKELEKVKLLLRKKYDI